jgi:hypothetical protein
MKYMLIHWLALVRSHMKQVSLRMQFDVHCTKVVISFHIQVVQRLQPEDNNFISSSVSGLYTKLLKNLTFCAFNVELCGNIHKEWGKESSLENPHATLFISTKI